MTRARDTANELSLITAKGDLLAGSASGVQSKLAVGANNTVLTADSATATGLKWGTISSSQNFSLLGTGTLTGASTITVSGISGINQIYVIIDGASATTGSSAISMRINGDTGSNYYRYGGDEYYGSVYSASANYQALQGASSVWPIANMSYQTTSVVSGYAVISGCNTSGKKMIHSYGMGSPASGDGQESFILGGYYDSSSTISSISLRTNGSNFDAGSFYIYGSA